MKRTHLFLPDPQLEALKALAEKTGLSVAELVRRAIDDFLNRQKQPANHTTTETLR